MTRAAPLRRPSRGFTLIDVTVALAVAGVLASVALPSYLSQLARARRAEAITALMQLQVAQEQFRAHHGSYALRLEALRGVVPHGEHHALTLERAHGDGYLARAELGGGARSDDCPALTLGVTDGVAAPGPSERCWNR